MRWKAAVKLGLCVGWGALSGEEVIELSPLTVEAWHFDSLAMETPVGVQRVESSQLERSGAGTVPEALERLAGLRFRGYTGNGSEGQVAMRGFGDNSGLRVLLIVDGQVYNPPDMGGINWLGLDIGELETVEVLRGGQTVLYGNHAVSGVIKLKTREPGERVEGKLELRAGSDGYLRGSASVGQQTGSLGLRAGGSWMESDGYRDYSGLESRGAYIAWNRGANNGSKWSGRFSYNQSKLQFPGPLSYEQMLENPRQSVTSGEDQSENDEWRATVRGEGVSPAGNWEAVAALMGRNRQWHLDGKEADNNLFRATFNPRFRMGSESAFAVAGIDLELDQVDYTEFLNGQRDIALAWADLKRQTAGAYLFGLKALPGGWQLSSGVRMESSQTDNEYVHYREEQLLPELETNRGTLPNPNYKNPPDMDPDLSFSGPVDKSGWAAEISLLKKLNPDLSLWCGWDRVYRYPSLDEAAAYQGFPLSDPLNTRLKPETGDNIELGMKRKGLNWELSVTAFWLLLNDEISYFEGEENGVPVRLNTNVGDTERRGLEAVYSYRKDRYGMQLTTTLVRALFRGGLSGRALPLVPSTELGFTVWCMPLEKVRLQVNGRYLSGQVQGNDFTRAARAIPSHFLTNISLYMDLGDGIKLTAGINNLSDETYAVSAYSAGFYPGAGRQAFAGLTCEF